MKIIFKRERTKNFVATKIGDTEFSQIQELSKKHGATKAEIIRTAIILGLKKLVKIKK